MAAPSVLENIELNDISAIKKQLKALKMDKKIQCKTSYKDAMNKPRHVKI